MKFSAAVFGIILSLSGVARCWFMSSDNQNTSAKFFSSEEDAARAVDSEESGDDGTAGFIGMGSNPDANDAKLLGMSDENSNA
ncbi:hypothetical protein HK407_06g10970 [Ordospora pajunii]|uniref:uncharacterized protein n=1 Tax=Ordospora pajunii TaxID=3039483 RepID=UPI00295286B0|nr:uncharacterized protein HK407_06g10970 [Ordospora pajunii]KAH9411267.1 hypothetical protein HK407_06g10970 [Ordospora pajunii]